MCNFYMMYYSLNNGDGDDDVDMPYGCEHHTKRKYSFPAGIFACYSLCSIISFSESRKHWHDVFILLTTYSGPLYIPHIQ